MAMGLGIGIGIPSGVLNSNAAPIPTTNHITTENEDSLMTESGDHIVT